MAGGGDATPRNAGCGGLVGPRRPASLRSDLLGPVGGSCARYCATGEVGSSFSSEPPISPSVESSQSGKSSSPTSPEGEVGELGPTSRPVDHDCTAGWPFAPYPCGGERESGDPSNPACAGIADVLGLEVWTSGQAAAVSRALRGGLGWSALGGCFCGVPIALLWCTLAGDDHGCNEKDCQRSRTGEEATADRLRTAEADDGAAAAAVCGAGAGVGSASHCSHRTRS